MVKTIMKKKNVIIVTICVVVSFIIYQLLLYFLLTISPANNVISVFDQSNIINLPINQLKRSEEDKFINENGLLRGVYVAQMSLYRPDHNNEFKCLITGDKIPFERVNDDYCDCEDATDEPSTSACPNGKFNCDTQFNKRPMQLNTVPSSKLNDGICDCCDGSDEWLQPVGQLVLSQSSIQHLRTIVPKCPNICHSEETGIN